jgi:hypothetical protein
VLPVFQKLDDDAAALVKEPLLRKYNAPWVCKQLFHRHFQQKRGFAETLDGPVERRDEEHSGALFFSFFYILRRR